MSIICLFRWLWRLQRRVCDADNGDDGEGNLLLLGNASFRGQFDATRGLQLLLLLILLLQLPLVINDDEWGMQSGKE